MTSEHSDPLVPLLSDTKPVSIGVNVTSVEVDRIAGADECVRGDVDFDDVMMSRGGLRGWRRHPVFPKLALHVWGCLGLADAATRGHVDSNALDASGVPSETGETATSVEACLTTSRVGRPGLLCPLIMYSLMDAGDGMLANCQNGFPRLALQMRLNADVGAKEILLSMAAYEGSNGTFYGGPALFCNGRKNCYQISGCIKTSAGAS